MHTLLTSRPHIVQVVSMLDVPRRFGSISFQSNDVRGAQKSEFLFCNVKYNILYTPKYSNILNFCSVLTWSWCLHTTYIHLDVHYPLPEAKSQCSINPAKQLATTSTTTLCVHTPCLISYRSQGCKKANETSPIGYTTHSSKIILH